MTVDVNNKCICPPNFTQSGLGRCVASADVSSMQLSGYLGDVAYAVTYYSAQDATGQPLGRNITVAESNLFKRFYLKSAIGCRMYQNLQDCQVLANLCVMQLYDEQTIACKLFQELSMNAELMSNQTLSSFYGNEMGWKEDMPWLYYS